MREPPATFDPSILPEALRAAYGLEAAAIRFLPLGHDSSAWVYHVRAADGAERFLKLRSGPLNPAGLRVPDALHRQGVPGVVAPIPARDGALWAAAGPLTQILYPFVDGQTGMAAGLSDAQWVAYGAALRRIHTAAVPADLAAELRRERYAPPGADQLRAADAALQGAPPADALGRELAAFWGERRAVILGLLGRAEELGRELAGRGLPDVLCHADIHTGNVLKGAGDTVWIVDWDEAMLAPKERDLMFALGGISRRLVGPREEALFLEGYGPAAIDAGALGYYRYAWAVSDIGSFAAELLFRPDLGDASRAAALELLRSLFAPGEIVSIATGRDGA